MTVVQASRLNHGHSSLIYSIIARPTGGPAAVGGLEVLTPLEMRVQRRQEVYVDALHLHQDTPGAQLLPPFARREVGGDLRL